MQVAKEKRVIKLQKSAQKLRGRAPDSKLLAQMAEVERLCDWTVNPRAELHLDTTKLAHHRDRVEAWMRGEHIAPITIDMALTQKCSMACVFCYAGLQQLPESPIPFEVYERFLEDCAEMGVKAISLVSDGESTENPNFLPFVLKAKSLGLDVASGTNGLKMPHVPELFGALTYLRFNFNAADPERYASIMGASVRSYERVIENINYAVYQKRAMNLPITIGLQMVLLPEYADEVIPLALLGRELGVDYLVIKHCSDDEDGSLGVDYDWYRGDVAQQLFRTAEALSTPTYSVQAKWSKFKTGRDRTYSKCYGTPFLLQMSGTGLVAPCGMLFHEKYKRYHIGDIATERFKDIWNSEAYRDVMAFLRSKEFDPRTMCGTLCLQDNLNTALFDLMENGAEIPEAKTQQHTNFV